MRYGFTTGSCAAAAAKAAAYMLLTGKIKNCITIETPKGIPYTAEVTDIVRGESQVSCAVVKDGGDDPDVTSGSKICATVTADNGGDGEKELLQIDGGKGVGRVTRPGLDQPVGNAAINHVPREMITREVQEVCRLCDFHGTLHILISVQQWKKFAGSMNIQEICKCAYPCRKGQRLRRRHLIQDWGLSGESQYWERQELWNR